MSQSQVISQIKRQVFDIPEPKVEVGVATANGQKTTRSRIIRIIQLNLVKIKLCV